MADDQALNELVEACLNSDSSSQSPPPELQKARAEHARFQKLWKEHKALETAIQMLRAQSLVQHLLQMQVLVGGQTDPRPAPAQAPAPPPPAASTPAPYVDEDGLDPDDGLG